jgi:MocE subfamily Rieske [2Fe-2S] domain protein
MSEENTVVAPEWVAAAECNAIASEDAIRFVHKGICIAVYILSGKFYATSGICTHEHAFLSVGYIDGETVECPLHQGLFNIRTGAALSPPVTKNLKTFKTKVENGQVYVLVEN